MTSPDVIQEYVLPSVADTAENLDATRHHPLRSPFLRRVASAVLGAALVATGATACNAESGSESEPTNHFYVQAASSALGATGVSVELTQEDPTVSPHDIQSAAEVFIDNGEEHVGMGWIVDPGYFRDNKPHLYIERFTGTPPNLVSQCGDAIWCGLDPMSTAIAYDQQLQPGITATYTIKYSDGEWQFFYDSPATGNQEVGYFPDTYPGAQFGGPGDRATHIVAYGEVATNNSVPCSEMGNGATTVADGAARIGKITLLGTTQPLKLYMYATNPSYYTYSDPTNGGIVYGGTGGPKADCK